MIYKFIQQEIGGGIMIDKNFNDLLIEIKNFLNLCLKVPIQLSNYGLSHSVSEAEKDFWRFQLPKETIPHYNKLKKYATENINNYLREVDNELSFFRQLPRYISEGPCVWSAYYEDIENSLDEMSELLDEIDEKYKLGWCNEKYEHK